MQTPSRLLIVAVISGWLAACGVTPLQEQVERDVGQAAHEQVPETPPEWLTAAESGEVQAGWVESFADPELTALIIEAQENNRDLAAAAANVDIAWSLARQAGAALVPSVSATAGAARAGSPSGAISTSSNLTLGAQVSWEADLWGRVRSGQRAAVAGAQAVEADFRSAQESLAAATAKAYFTAIEANIQADIARETVRILEETQRIVNVQFENGMASAQDNALARSDLASARERLTTVESSYRDAVRALEVSAGGVAVGTAGTSTGSLRRRTAGCGRLQRHQPGPGRAAADHQPDRQCECSLELVIQSFRLE